MNKGIWYGVGAYTLWGVLPIYWKWLHQISALQLISHRILWSFLALISVILFWRQGKEFRKAIWNSRIFYIYLAAAILLGINWLTYVWAVNAGFIVQTSLGYFINPLLSVLLGVIFLRERLRLWQWFPIGMAAAGVLYLTFAIGSLPWIALTLAFSFAIYGFVKKTAPLGSLYGLTMETGILLLPACIFLLYSEIIGQGAFLHTSIISDLLMIDAGLVTTLPLLMFSSAAQRIPLSLVGILQYIAPTLQFLIGVLIYKEPFSHAQFIGYSIIWAALIIYAMEGYLHHRIQAVALAA